MQIEDLQLSDEELRYTADVMSRLLDVEAFKHFMTILRTKTQMETLMKRKLSFDEFIEIFQMADAIRSQNLQGT